MSAEKELRKLWTEKGVSQDEQDRLIQQIKDKAKPGTMVGPFRLGGPVPPPKFRSELTEAGEQTVIPGCEADDEQTGSQQLSLF